MTRPQFWIDVGGTFTDCILRRTDGTLVQHKTLSSGIIKGAVDASSTCNAIVDARRKLDSPNFWRGFRIRFLQTQATRTIVAFQDGQLQLDEPLPQPATVGEPYELSSNQPAPLLAIRHLLGLPSNAPLPPVDVRLGTTRGTNALLTRSGAKTALVTTAGFRDILRIGYQARPDLFTLDIRKPEELYSHVIEVNERMDAQGAVLRELDEAEVHNQLQALKADKVDSLAIALLHASTNPAHEQRIKAIAYKMGFSEEQRFDGKPCFDRKLGFEKVSVSHEVSSLRKLVPRGDTTVIDAYLGPVLDEYLNQIRTALHPDSRLQLMKSSGGLANADDFRGKDSILSGPAGGVVGVAKAATLAGFQSAIGFDMGGTSTDVCRWSGEFELEYETEKAGQRIATPMLAIETVAAGGGSLCQFDGVKLTVGPKSAGASPGPACYGAGGPLAVTDINFFLGKILPDAFPFDLDIRAVRQQLASHCDQIKTATGRQLTLEQLAEGYLRIANTSMAEAIRSATIERGVDPRDDVLVAFGGAAGQHACGVAEELGIQSILLHPSAGIMSALGIGLADLTVYRETGVYQPFEEFDQQQLQPLFDKMRADAATELAGEGELRNKEEPCDENFRDRAGGIQFTESLDLRFSGLDEPINVIRPPDGDFRSAYESIYQNRCGYLPNDRKLELVIARVAATISDSSQPSPSQRVSLETTPTSNRTSRVVYAGIARDAKVFSRQALHPGSIIREPAIITEDISTTIIDPGWQAEVLTGGELLLKQNNTDTIASARPAATANPDPVLLEVFNQRFAAIASQMGSTLRRTSRSVNVKERLDYSCAIFTAEGKLVVNAPHIPVHLGAMGATVRHVLGTFEMQPGDVVVTNDPYHGGSHLPDVTVVSPIHDQESGELLFFTASRAHHAEIGGVTPGSMPPFSRNLAEEGVLISAMKVIDRGQPRIEELRELLTTAEFPSRDPELNIADIRAQIAANRHGATSLLRFVQDHSWSLVSDYMGYIQDAAEQKMRSALSDLADGCRTFVDHLDDGTPISLTLTITGDQATLDFSGTGGVLPGNLNANRAIVTAAVMYCLRCLIKEDIPLNQGVLAPINILLPNDCCLNPTPHEDPRQCPAIVGGNVETSQRVVDVVLGAFEVAAASQGTMNNLLFGDATFGYYETICGGAGATATASGAEAVHTHMTNTRLTDPEVLESRFPVRLRRFEIRQDSGGAGQHHGGNGVTREIEFLLPMEVALITQRRSEYTPYGLNGGCNGQQGANYLIRDGRREQLKSLAHITVNAGDAIRIESPGGGGFGKMN